MAERRPHRSKDATSATGISTRSVLPVPRSSYESDAILGVLRPAAARRDVRHSPHIISDGYKVAVAFLAGEQPGIAARPHQRIDMKLLIFVPGYCRLMARVWLGTRKTDYPLGVAWRWRHMDYIDL